MRRNRGGVEVVVILCILGFFIFVGLLMYVPPKYSVWSRNLKGQAQLKQQEWSKKIMVEEAKARRDSAALLAEAEVERAKGVAKANEIIGVSLKGNEVYLRYLWVQGLHDGSSEVIYIPTEANLPILEAVRGLKR